MCFVVCLLRCLAWLVPLPAHVCLCSRGFALVVWCSFCLLECLRAVLTAKHGGVRLNYWLCCVVSVVVVVLFAAATVLSFGVIANFSGSLPTKRGCMHAAKQMYSFVNAVAGRERQRVGSDYHGFLFGGLGHACHQTSSCQARPTVSSPSRI